MKKKNLIIVMASVIILALLITLFANRNHVYAIQLKHAIERNDRFEIEGIIEKHPESINTYPTLVPRLFRGIADNIVQYPLAIAAKDGNTEIVQLLIDNGAEINAKDDILSDTALLCALNSDEENRFQIAELLVKCGADVTLCRKNNDNYDAVHCCVMSMARDNQKQSEEGLITLISICDATPNGYDFGKALCESMISGVDSAVDYLLEKPIPNPDAVQFRGYTILTCACKYNYVSVVKRMVDRNCARDVKDKYGKTGLMYAMENQNDEIASILRGRSKVN